MWSFQATAALVVFIIIIIIIIIIPWCFSHYDDRLRTWRPGLASQKKGVLINTFTTTFRDTLGLSQPYTLCIRITFPESKGGRSV
jgi:lipopolysaccharide export LptBFGC system permease protein LptF